jgi:glycosyltransferase involved in cell wall biosynthesis
MSGVPRVAFFADSFHEVNGVANTCRHFEAFARRRSLPFLSIHAGEVTKQFQDGSITRLELKRGPLSFALDSDLGFDLALWRYVKPVTKALRDFKADLVHITGPSDVGQLGAYVAHKLKLPLVASWHTNLHDFAARRIESLLRFTPGKQRKQVATFVERQVLRSVLRFYHIPRVLMAPNLELAEMIEARTGKPTYLMQRGIDTELFSPARRDRGDDTFTLGYVGRLTPEKNVRLLADIESSLLAAGHLNFRFTIVGDGSQRAWLERNMRHAEMTGVLHGDALARAYANMDLFIFPSETDAFGNVVLEAIASGVPVIVAEKGGPKFIIEQGVCGYTARTEQDFFEAANRLMSNEGLRSHMKSAARLQAQKFSWNRVFEEVYRAYAVSINMKRAEIVEAGSGKAPVRSAEDFGF